MIFTPNYKTLSQCLAELINGESKITHVLYVYVWWLPICSFIILGTSNWIHPVSSHFFLLWLSGCKFVKSDSILIMANRWTVYCGGQTKKHDFTLFLHFIWRVAQQCLTQDQTPFCRAQEAVSFVSTQKERWFMKSCLFKSCSKLA